MAGPGNSRIDEYLWDDRYPRRDDRRYRYGRDDDYRYDARPRETRSFGDRAEEGRLWNELDPYRSDEMERGYRRSRSFSPRHFDFRDEQPRYEPNRYTPNPREGRGYEERDFWSRTRDEVASWFGDHEAERRREWDAMHSGKGPKNYQRSDARIAEDINDRMTEDPYLDASDIEVTVASREVTLNGFVPDRASKRRAEDLVERISGVGHVQNNLRARDAERFTGDHRVASTATPVAGITNGDR